MADISKIILPDGTTYCFKDEAARAAIEEGGGSGSTVTQHSYAITEDIVTVTTSATKGVSPYNTSYGMTYIEIAKSSGVAWVEGATYTFVVNTTMVVGSSYRNVAVRIGGDSDGDTWHPVMGYTSTIENGNAYLVKSMTVVFVYKTVYQTGGALHRLYDANSTYDFTYAFLAGTHALEDYPVQYYALCAETENGGFAPITTTLSTSTQTTRAPNVTTKFKIGGLIAEYSTTTQRAVGYVLPQTTMRTASRVNNIGYTLSADSTGIIIGSEDHVTAFSDVYLKVKDNSDGTFSLDSDLGTTTIATHLSTSLPTSDDGYLYLLLCQMNNSTFTCTYWNHHPIYRHDGERIILGNSIPSNGGSGGTVSSRESYELITTVNASPDDDENTYSVTINFSKNYRKIWVAIIKPESSKLYAVIVPETNTYTGSNGIGNFVNQNRYQDIFIECTDAPMRMWGFGSTNLVSSNVTATGSFASKYNYTGTANGSAYMTGLTINFMTTSSSILPPSGSVIKFYGVAY